MERLKMMWGEPKVQKSFFYSAFFISVAVIVAEIVVLVLFRETWADEVFSSFKSYLLLKGELIPFVEGNFEYSPLVIVTFGLAQYFFGPNLYAGRILSVIFLVAAIALFSYLLKQRAKGWGMIAGVALVGSNMLLMGNYITTTMYAIVFFFMMLLILVQERVKTTSTQVLLSSIIISILIMARINMVVVLIGYVVFLVLTRTKFKFVLMSLGIVALVIFLAYLPIVRANPSLAIASILSPFGNFGPLADLPASLKVGSQTIFRFIEVLGEFVKEYFGYLALAFLSAIALISTNVKERGFTAIAADRTYLLTLMLSIVLVGSHYFYWRIVSNVYYANYFIPLLILLSIFSIVKMSSGRGLLWGMVAVVIFLNGSINIYRTDVISDPRAESDIARVNRGAEALAKYTKPSDKILTFDNSIYHVYLADRRTYFPLINRDFLFLNSTDTSYVRKIGFYNTEMLKDWLVHDADYFLQQQETWPSSFIRSRFWATAEGGLLNDVEVLNKTIKEKYELVDTVYNVYPRKYTEGNDGGTLLIYKRRIK